MVRTDVPTPNGDTALSMDIADSVKNQGLLGFMRLVGGGPELSLEFKKGEYSKAVKITLDGHEVTAYLTLVPAEGTPNMELTITSQRMGAWEDLQSLKKVNAGPVGAPDLSAAEKARIKESEDAAKAQLEADLKAVAEKAAEEKATLDAAKAKAEFEASGTPVPGAAPTGEKAPAPEEKKNRFNQK